jgi:GNAT superfamily N-acetyltransferase
MPELDLLPVRADDASAVRAWFDVRAAVTAADLVGDPLPSWSAHRGILGHPWPGTDSRVWLACGSGEPVGWLGFSLSLRENLDTAPMDLEVHPAHRQRGHGRTLLGAATELAKDLGRTRLVGEAVIGGPGATFAERTGFRPALVDTQRMLDLGQLDHARLAELMTEARSRAAGYSLVQWVGPTPEEHVEALAVLESRMTTDAPFDDLEWEQEVFDAQRLRARDAAKEARELRSYTTAVVHDATGEAVGFSCIVVAADVPEMGDQWQTIVLPEHRGHRLGMLLKIANLRFLQEHEPAVRRIDTWNADSNAPMLRVNLALGFQVVRQWAEWELRL